MLSDGKGGAIVNLASIASLIGMKDRFVYQMTKGAVLTMTLSVATDYVKKGYVATASHLEECTRHLLMAT